MLLPAMSLATFLLASASAGSSIMVVDLSSSYQSTLATKIAVQTCAGLFNRQEQIAGAAYVLMDPRDRGWLSSIEGIKDPYIMPTEQFLSRCLGSGVAKGYIQYNASTQQLVLPNIITLAGVLDAVPLEAGHPSTTNSSMIFDASAKFVGFSAYDATKYMYENYVHETTSMSKMNPGLDVHHHPVNPPLTGSLDPGLVDFIVKERLFNFFLNEGCIPFTKEHALMEQMVRQNPWPKPIAVYGYDDTYPIAGDLYEAETTCVKEHNLGQIASSGVNNLAFFSRKPRIEIPLIQNHDLPSERFNNSKTYVTLIVGDGDNLAFLKGSRRDWFQERVRRCQAKVSGKLCFPLGWTMSPAILHAAPDWARWYFNQSYLTKQDFFVLPPSGDLYSYPSMMRDGDQKTFVQNTERDGWLLNTSGMVAWEWFGQWPHAIQSYFPRYSQNQVIRSAFAVNVPFNLPVEAFWEDWKLKRYKVLNSSVVLFRPREWRGTSGKSGGIPFSRHNMLSAKDMAKEINEYPKGTVSHIYMTSDGGAELQDFFDLVELLESHVAVVPPGTAADMALQASSADVEMPISFIVV